MKFNVLDGLILLVIALGLWRGFITGLIRELSQLFGIFVAFAIALQVMKPAGVFMVQVVNIVDMPVEGAALIAFVVVFIIVYLIVHFSARVLERVADGVKLGPINKLFGGAFGAAKAALVLSILMVFFGQVGLPGEDAESASYLYGPIERIAPEAWDVFAKSVPKATTLTHVVGERFWLKPEEKKVPRPPESSEQQKAVQRK